VNTKVEVQDGDQIRLSVTVDAAEVDDRIKKAYKDFAFKYNFPGFRRGRAPRPVIDNALGAEAVRASVTEGLVQECYPLAVDESGIYPLGQPDFEDSEALVEAGKPFTFSAKTSVKPQFELTGYEPVSISLPGEEATEEEVQLQIDALREHYYTMEDAPASATIEEGGFADLAMTALDDKGEPVESLATERRFYALGSGVFPQEFDSALIGMKQGDKKGIDLEFKGLYTAGLASVAGQTDSIHFDIEVKAVKEKALPEVTEEWAVETCGFESLDDLKARITESVTQNKKGVLPQLKEAECLGELGKRLEGEIPAALVAAAETDLLQNFYRQLQGQGIALDSYLRQQGITVEQFREDVRKQAEDITRQDLALDAWARHKGMAATDEDLAEEFAKSGAEDPAKLEEQWRANGRLHILREGILRSRAVKDVMDTAIVTEPNAAPKPAKAKKADPQETPKKAKAAKAAPGTEGAEEAAPDPKAAKEAPARKASSKPKAKAAADTKADTKADA
jgi:trigger factor